MPGFCLDARWKSLPTGGPTRAWSCCQGHWDAPGDGPDWGLASAWVSGVFEN